MPTLGVLTCLFAMAAFGEPYEALIAQGRATLVEVDLPENAAEAAAERPIARCRGILSEMTSVAGEGATACSESPTMKVGIACANDSFKKSKPFTLCQASSGMDSFFELGVAGRKDGSLVVFYSDTMGPQYRGVCARANVALNNTGWPQCTRELTERVKLGTGEPYRHYWERDEDWPEACRERALVAKRFEFPPKPLKMTSYVTDPERWGVDCGHFSLGFDLLIDQEGKVVCAQVGREVSRVGLVEEIRRNLETWRFEKPQIYGVPVDARWGMHAWRCGP